MGVAHLLGGGSRLLADLGQDGPLLRDEEVELFGFDPAELDKQRWTTLTTRRLATTPAPAVRTDPAGVVVTEVDPIRDPDGTLLRDLAEVLVAALA